MANPCICAPSESVSKVMPKKTPEEKVAFSASSSNCLNSLLLKEMHPSALKEEEEPQVSAATAAQKRCLASVAGISDDGQKRRR